MRSLLNLPLELLAAILGHLSARDILACASTSKTLLHLVRTSSKLKYIVLLAHHRLLPLLPDNHSLSYSSRLQMLTAREHAWRTLSWSARHTLRLPPTGSVYEFVGGLYANGREDDDRVTASISFLELPSSDMAYLGEISTPSLKTWTHPMNDVEIIDFTMDPSQDLLVLVALAPETSKYTYTLHLRTISANEPHPLAPLPVLPCLEKVPSQPPPPELVAAVRVQVSGDLLGLLIKEAPDNVGAHLEIWNWLDDPYYSCSQSYDDGIDDFTFLSHSSFLLVLPAGQLHVYTFPDPLTSSRTHPSPSLGHIASNPAQGSRTKSTCLPTLRHIYELPPLSQGYQYWYISMSCNPAPGYVPSSRPFVYSRTELDPHADNKDRPSTSSKLLISQNPVPKPDEERKAYLSSTLNEMGMKTEEHAIAQTQYYPNESGTDPGRRGQGQMYHPLPEERIHACCVYVFNPNAPAEMSTNAGLAASGTQANSNANASTNTIPINHIRSGMSNTVSELSTSDEEEILDEEEEENIDLDEDNQQVHSFVFFVNLRTLSDPPEEWLRWDEVENQKQKAETRNETMEVNIKNEVIEKGKRTPAAEVYDAKGINPSLYTDTKLNTNMEIEEEAEVIHTVLNLGSPLTVPHPGFTTKNETIWVNNTANLHLSTDQYSNIPPAGSSSSGSSISPTTNPNMNNAYDMARTSPSTPKSLPSSISQPVSTPTPMPITYNPPHNPTPVSTRIHRYPPFPTFSESSPSSSSGPSSYQPQHYDRSEYGCSGPWKNTPSTTTNGTSSPVAKSRTYVNTSNGMRSAYTGSLTGDDNDNNDADCSTSTPSPSSLLPSQNHTESDYYPHSQPEAPMMPSSSSLFSSTPLQSRLQMTMPHVQSKATKPSLIPWHVWGPGSTRWFEESLSTDWQHAVYGLRTVDSVSATRRERRRRRERERWQKQNEKERKERKDAKGEEQMDSSALSTSTSSSSTTLSNHLSPVTTNGNTISASRRYLRVRDFNPYALRVIEAELESRTRTRSPLQETPGYVNGKGKGKERAILTSMPSYGEIPSLYTNHIPHYASTLNSGSDIRNPSNKSKKLWNTVRVMRQPSVTPVKGVFAHDIVSSLPYTEVETEETFELTDVMMDDCRLLLLKRGQMGKLESVEVLMM